MEGQPCSADVDVGTEAADGPSFAQHFATDGCDLTDPGTVEPEQVDYGLLPSVHWK